MSDFVPLRGILMAINACETMEIELSLDEPKYSRFVRKALHDYKDRLGEFYTTNEELAVFDAVFTECGWDDQGFRWINNYAIYIVEFTNEQHTEWRKI